MYYLYNNMLFIYYSDELRGFEYEKGRAGSWLSGVWLMRNFCGFLQNFFAVHGLRNRSDENIAESTASFQEYFDEAEDLSEELDNEYIKVK